MLGNPSPCFPPETPEAGEGSCPAFGNGAGEKGIRRVPYAANTSSIRPEYRRRIIELAYAGRSIDHLARESEASAKTIRKWVK